MPGRRKCDSYKTFDKNIARAGAFLRLFDLDRTQGRPSADDNELLRAAVLFAVGALDSMLSDLILEIIPRFGGDSKAKSVQIMRRYDRTSGLWIRNATTGVSL